jgi:serine protease Do
MHQTMIQRYENGCMMLMDKRADGYHFLGTAFIVHAQGYLLTAAHLLEKAEHPIAVAPAQAGVFSPLYQENAVTFALAVARTDSVRDIALLKMDLDVPIGSPDDIIGNPDEIKEGVYLLSFGVSFGHLRIHNIIVMHAMLSAKLLSPNETRLLLFDASIHPGGVGGPLVNSEDGRIVGVMQGIFDPLQIAVQDAPKDYHLPSHISYAVSIEYGRALLKAEGL